MSIQQGTIQVAFTTGVNPVNVTVIFVTDGYTIRLFFPQTAITCTGVNLIISDALPVQFRPKAGYLCQRMLSYQNGDTDIVRVTFTTPAGALLFSNTHDAGNTFTAAPHVIEAFSLEYPIV